MLRPRLHRHGLMEDRLQRALAVQSTASARAKTRGYKMQ
jgi:hypothetical protein